MVYIKISLPAYLQDYLIALFSYDKKSKTIVINESISEGKYICSMWEPAERDYTREYKEPCIIAIPENAYNKYKLESSYIHIPVWKEKMIENHIRSSFELKMREMFAIGRHYGISQKTICEAIISEYNTLNNTLTFDKVKKFDYRRRKRYSKNILDILQAAVL